MYRALFPLTFFSYTYHFSTSSYLSNTKGKSHLLLRFATVTIHTSLLSSCTITGTVSMPATLFSTFIKSAFHTYILLKHFCQRGNSTDFIFLKCLFLGYISPAVSLKCLWEFQVHIQKSATHVGVPQTYFNGTYLRKQSQMQRHMMLYSLCAQTSFFSPHWSLCPYRIDIATITRPSQMQGMAPDIISTVTQIMCKDTLHFFIVELQKSYKNEVVS